jgi:hypothetical protein
MPRILALTAVWRRPALTELVLKSYLRTKEAVAGEIELELLAVGSEGEFSRDLCRGCGWEYVEHANEPLSYKWNAGIRGAEAYNPDAVVLVGSDAFLSQATFPAYIRRLEEGFDFFGFRDLYFFDPSHSRLGYWGGYEHTAQKDRAGEPIGCGRCFSRRLLDRMKWSLWPKEPRVNTLLDRLALNFAKVHGFRPRAWTMGELGAWGVEIKTGFNLTPFDAIEYVAVQAGEPAVDRLRTWFHPDDLAALTRLPAIGDPEAV